jgi:hypothetical protein
LLKKLHRTQLAGSRVNRPICSGASQFSEGLKPHLPKIGDDDLDRLKAKINYTKNQPHENTVDTLPKLP